MAAKRPLVKINLLHAVRVPADSRLSAEDALWLEYQSWRDRERLNPEPEHVARLIRMEREAAAASGVLFANWAAD